MSASKIPMPLREAARQLFAIAATLRFDLPPPPPPSLTVSDSGGTDMATFFAVDPALGLATDEEFLRRYLIYCADETPLTLGALVAAGVVLAGRAEDFLRATDQRAELKATESDPLARETLAAKLARWIHEWHLLRRWSELWGGFEMPSRQLDKRDTPDHDLPRLSGDQLRAAERLECIWRARQADGRAGSLPRSILPRWTHPMMIGPAGSGKAFTAQAVASRLGLAFARVEVGSWIIIANRSGRATADIIEQFSCAYPAGVLIYVSGVDALSSARLGGDRGDGNTSWWGAVSSELQSFLDATSTRQPTRGNDLPRPMVVLAGRFAPLWGEIDVGGPSGADAWRTADAEALREPMAIAEWLAQHGGLPAGLTHRISPVPLVVARPDPNEAAALAAAMMAALPSAMDGVLEVSALTAALGSPAGWRAVAHLVEEGLTGSP